MLSHEWCYEYKVVISYKDEQVTFLQKDRPRVLKFYDSHVETCAMTSSLCSIHQVTRFVHKQQRVYLAMIRRVAEHPAGDDTRSDHAHEAAFPQKVDPQVLKNLLKEFKELFSDSLSGLPPHRGVYRYRSPS